MIKNYNYKFIRVKSIVFIAIVFIILCSGWLFRLLKIEPTIILNGVVPEVERPTISMGGLLNGQVGLLTETWMKNDIPFHNMFIKIRNQVYWSLFHKSTNLNVVIGKNFVLYEPSYVLEYLGYTKDDEYDKTLIAMEKNVQDLKFIQDKLEKVGKISYVFYTPNKVDFTENFIPSKYIENAPKNDRQRYCDVLLNLFNKYEIKYFDSVRYFKENNSQTTIFPRSGTHYTWAAGVSAGLEMINEINKISNIKFRKVEPIFSQTKKIYYPDKDLFDILNLFESLSWTTYSKDLFYTTELKNKENTRQAPKVFIQGGSFEEAMFVIFQQSNAADRFYFVRNKDVSDCSGIKTIKNIEEIDVGCNLNNDVFIFEVNQLAANKMSFGFIQHMKNYIEKNGIPNNIQVRSEK